MRGDLAVEERRQPVPVTQPDLQPVALPEESRRRAGRASIASRGSGLASVSEQWSIVSGSDVTDSSVTAAATSALTPTPLTSTANAGRETFVAHHAPPATGGIDSTVPGWSARGLEMPLAAAIWRQRPALPYSCWAIALSVSPALDDAGAWAGDPRGRVASHRHRGVDVLAQGDCQRRAQRRAVGAEQREPP